MSILLRPAFALLAVVVLNLGVRGSDGFYSHSAFAATIAALGLGFAACVVPERPFQLTRSGRFEITQILFILAAIFLGFTAINSAGLYYAEDSAANARVVLSIKAALGLTLIVALVAAVDAAGLVRLRSCWILLPILILMLVGGVVIRARVIDASPEPVIDVYNLLRDYADHMIAGVNPYEQDIITPYGTPRAEKFGVANQPDPRPAGYPPLPFLLCIPPRLLGADVRWANILGDGMAALALALIGWRRRPFLGILAAATYLNLPRAPFLIEQAWYEPMIAAFFGLGLLLAESERWPKYAGYIFLGLALTAKQFGLPLLFPLVWSHRKSWRLILVGLIAGAMVMLPWFIWSPHAFVEIVLLKHLGRPPQPESITVGSFVVNAFGLEMPRIIGWAAATITILLIARFTPKGPAAAIGLGTALLAFCVFHTQGYLNYFFLVQYLWLFGAMASLNRDPGIREISLLQSPLHDTNRCAA